MRRKRGYGKIILTLLVIAVLGAAYFISNSPAFEQNPPTAALGEQIFWNGKDDINLSMSDDSGIKQYTIKGLDGKGKELFSDTIEAKNAKDVTANLDLKRWLRVAKEIVLELQITDTSKANFFSGNTATYKSTITIDRKRPTLAILSNSYSITKGGSALVVFSADDDNLKEVYIKSGDKKFIPQKFINDKNYISLVAWSVLEDNFSANIVAKDAAGNVAIQPIRYFLREKNYSTSKLTLKEDFLKGKITALIEEVGDAAPDSLVDRFFLVNRDYRNKNEALIEKITSQIDPNYVVAGFSLTPFYPLKNAAAVASFGSHRFFSYNGQNAGESYHLGLDLASVKQADIKTNNKSYVAFAGFNGIYGNMLALYHGLGLYSIYGHCTEIFAKKGSFVNADAVVALTGTTGLALGDHLHFGVLVQGIEVRPEEWMDQNWITKNITDIIKNAKTLVEKRGT